MKLKELRKSHKLTQQELASILKITPSAYANYEQGRREPDIEVITTLANFYGVSVDYLLGREESPPPLINKNTVSIIGRGGGKKDIVLDDEQFQAVKTILENIAKQNEENN